MALAVLYLVLALVAFLGATVVAVMIMTRVEARRGRRSRPADGAMVSKLRSRRRRLDRRLGIHEDESPEAPRADAETAERVEETLGRSD